MHKSPYIEYHRNNLEYARKNRNGMTKAERKLWYDFLRKRPLEFKFLRQKQLGPFIADFYCSRLLLVIEVDGSSHDGKYVEDCRRTDYINDLGILVLRIKNKEVYDEFDLVKARIERVIGGRINHIVEWNKHSEKSLLDKGGGTTQF